MEKETIDNVENVHEEVSVSSGETVKKSSHEALFGTILFAVLILFVIGSVAGVGYAVYSKWKIGKEEAARPSIKSLAVEPEPAKTEAAKTETVSETSTEDKTAAAQDAAASAKQKDVSVLNGGAAKGTAGMVADALKKEGYAKVSTGNTVSDYTGVTIYYASGLEKEAGILKESLVKKYPAAVLKPAVATNKETSVASLTIILGK